MSIQLAATLINLEDEIGEMLAQVTAMPDSDYLNSEMMMDLAFLFRQWGIGSLLIDMDLDRFVAGLFTCERTYLRLLEKSKVSMNIESYYLCRSRAMPIFDAVVIADRYAVKEIGKLVEQVRQPELEEEDDFCYMDFLISFILNSPNISIQEKKIVSFEYSLQGVVSSRYTLCEALYKRNEADYWEALADILNHSSQQMLEEQKNGLLQPSYRHTEAHVSIEGAALIRLGEMAGFTADLEYLMIPSAVFNTLLEIYPQEDPWNQYN